MSSDRSPRGRPSRQSIPLQDLSRPPDGVIQDDVRPRPLRVPSTRSRQGLGSRHSFTGRHVNTAYERVSEGSPPPGERSHALPHVTTPRNAHQPYDYDDGEVSPVNAGDFATAMGSVGLSFEPSFEAAVEPAIEPSAPSRSMQSRPRSTLNVITETDAMTNFPPATSSTINEPEADQYFSPQETDQTPLTDTRFLAPIDGAQSSTHSAGHSRYGSRLGDDLNVEAGLRARPSSTLSSKSFTQGGSTISRAGTILRKASQRVVNLSNEPDAIDSSMRRRPSANSVGDGRMEGPPALPAMLDYAHDDSNSSIPAEKGRPSVSATEEPADKWPQRNPLKGKSLGIFGPNSWIRLQLCEMLVHPITEPTILILIVIQTVVLAVESAPTVDYYSVTDPNARFRRTWPSWPSAILFALFCIYTLEIAARIIVSGFVKNAEDYSTTDTSLGWVASVKERIAYFFTPRVQPSTKAMFGPSNPGPSVLRSFTSTQVPVDQPGHGRQAQRIRLARRAFLRHGFNRLDFVAVISFWASFFLSIFHVEPRSHIYIFHMMSCLRILRLLGLTSGTSVICPETASADFLY